MSTEIKLTRTEIREIQKNIKAQFVGLRGKKRVSPDDRIAYAEAIEACCEVALKAKTAKANRPACGPHGGLFGAIGAFCDARGTSLELEMKYPAKPSRERKIPVPIITPLRNGSLTLKYPGEAKKALSKQEARTKKPFRTLQEQLDAKGPKELREILKTLKELREHNGFELDFRHDAPLVGSNAGDILTKILNYAQKAAYEKGIPFEVTFHGVPGGKVYCGIKADYNWAIPL
jgi:hypothetical protein